MQLSDLAIFKQTDSENGRVIAMPDDTGVRLAYQELLRVLFERDIITSDDINSILAALTDLSGVIRKPDAPLRDRSNLAMP